MIVTLTESAERLQKLRRIARKIVASRTPEEKRAAANRAIEKANSDLAVANEAIAELEEYEVEEYETDEEQREALARELENGFPEGTEIEIHSIGDMTNA